MITPPDNNETPRNMRWLANHSLIILGLAVFFSFLSLGVDGMAATRKFRELLPEADYNLVTDATGYCFAVFSITLISLLFIDVKFRAGITYLQYGLSGAALSVFYLMLLAFAEQMPFWLAYVIVGAMTGGLIALFIKGITKQAKAARLAGLMIAVEYIYILVLLYLCSLALLLGSLALFIIIAVAMYFTLKMKLINDEITFS